MFGLTGEPAATGGQPDRWRVSRAAAGLGTGEPPRKGAIGMLNQLRPVHGKYGVNPFVVGRRVRFEVTAILSGQAPGMRV